MNVDDIEVMETSAELPEDILNQDSSEIQYDTRSEAGGSHEGDQSRQDGMCVVNIVYIFSSFLVTRQLIWYFWFVLLQLSSDVIC